MSTCFRRLLRPAADIALDPSVLTLGAPSMQSAVRLKPTFTDAYNNMASALVQKSMIPAALQCYRAALMINPNLVCLMLLWQVFEV